MKHLFLALAFLSLSICVKAQKQYFISQTSEKIVLDGQMNEAVWEEAQMLTGFVQNFPTDSLPATSQTEIRLTYDDKNIYFCAKMYNQSEDRKYVTPSLRRDYRGSANDMITFVIDTYQDNTNAFNFGINPWGVLREGLISNGGSGRRNLSNSWDNKWKGGAQTYPGYWIAEFAIPFKTLRYKEGSKAWNINFYRIDTETGERSTLTPIPRNYSVISLAFLSELIWDKPLGKPGSNISLIPYSSAASLRDFEDPESTGPNSSLNVGGDAKIALTPALNLDLTFNPDFSQVEVDEQVTNLNRFELFFPEKRQFFLENADLFSSFGHPIYTRTFFSRRIGIAEDTVRGENVQNRIIYGARLSGKLDNNWRVGLLNMQTERKESIFLPGNNYTVGVVQRKIFARSNVGAMFTNKQSFDEPSEANAFTGKSFNRVLNIEYNIASADNKWIGKWAYQKSWDNKKDPKEYAFSGWVGYRSRTWEWDWAHTYNGDNFNSEMGFVPRTGFFRINPGLGYNFYPGKGQVTQYSVSLKNETLWMDNRRSDHNFEFTHQFRYKNTADLTIVVAQDYTYLFDDFDPTNTDGTELLADTEYTYNTIGIGYDSDQRKKIGYEVLATYGQYFNGTRYRLGTELNMRFQPYAAISLNMNYNKIIMPAPYTSADIWLIGPRFDLTFTRSLFLASFVQFNSQAENFNVNTRLQWRFKPVSDLFIVYTDNYATEDMSGRFAFQKKNRALVVKMTYWLNI
ncbi:MAG: carbohydrate binding family 9 domain-containing protein [Cyclobacteriaceae bacterium]